ncbi:orotidine-5'-phosphate decarboxylase [Hyphomonas sp. WL0036]|uniref:orotidine-5'-phosphate decarboxylase n=1 Tax=Hyphomonas sediminis TaxID=2866160 RepID=UPI001C7F19FC|nr:orotidine-5'-phosphate decarboxylase [Hyphomonas sediminis]MBY9066155.1 orotidine-5'-phosphate decarboxylase [Hyphomonas sediminis]
MIDFATRLTEGTRKFGPLCVGIDPHPGLIPELFGGDTPEGVRNWALAMVDAAAGKVAIIKPQVSLFERHGPEGMAALQAVGRAGRAAGLLVLMDAKRGDIGTTAEGYANAYLASGAPFECDALTVNPYMGLDTIEPYAKIAKAEGKGVVVLVRTSNPGAADFQRLDTGGKPLYVRVAEALAPLSERLMSPCGWSNLMMVVGATAPEEARQVRAVAPKALFLVPGYGAQNGRPEDAMAGLMSTGNAVEGGVISASRSISFPSAAAGAGSIDAWQAAIASAIEAARAELAGAAYA